MNRNLGSFFLSLVIHVVLLAGIYASYKATVTSLESKKHPCECCSTTINLSAIKTEKIIPKKSVPQKKKTVQEKKITKITKPKIKQDTVHPKAIEHLAMQTQQPQPKVVSTIDPLVETNSSKAVKKVNNAQHHLTKDKHCDKDVVVAPVKKQSQQDYLSLHVTRIVSLLKENLYYPRRARKKGIQGVVNIRFTLSKDAKVSHIKVLQSDYEILSRAAVRTIEELSGQLPRPDEELTLTIPIEYTLN